jgi:L-asparagine oxygenase
MTGQLLETELYLLSSSEQSAIRDFLETREFPAPSGHGSSFDAFCRSVAPLVKVLPEGLIEHLAEFRRSGGSRGVLLIRGMPVASHLGPTPPTFVTPDGDSGGLLGAACLVGTTMLLGEVFAFSTQHSGNLVQNIVPVKSRSTSQTGLGSAVFLEWHVEDAFSDLRPDFVALLCLRGDSSAKTCFASVRDLPLSATTRGILSEDRFRIGVDPAHDGLVVGPDEPVAVLTGDPQDPLIRFDPLFTTPAATDDVDAAHALEELAAALAEARNDVTLEAGDLLIFDNFRVLHARTPYAPRYDGADRWLQRVIIASSFTRAAGTCRVVDTASPGITLVRRRLVSSVAGRSSLQSASGAE